MYLGQESTPSALCIGNDEVQFDEFFINHSQRGPETRDWHTLCSSQKRDRDAVETSGAIVPSPVRSNRGYTTSVISVLSHGVEPWPLCGTLVCRIDGTDCRSPRTPRNIKKLDLVSNTALREATEQPMASRFVLINGELEFSFFGRIRTSLPYRQYNSARFRKNI